MQNKSKLADANTTQLKMDYSEVFSTEAGRRVLLDLMTACHVLEPEPDNNVENIVARAHRRDVIHHIFYRMGNCYSPVQFLEFIGDTNDA